MSLLALLLSGAFCEDGATCAFASLCLVVTLDAEGDADDAAADGGSGDDVDANVDRVADGDSSGGEKGVDSAKQIDPMRPKVVLRYVSAGRKKTAQNSKSTSKWNTKRFARGG